MSAADQAPTSTQGKPTFAAADAGIPDDAHVSTQYQSTITNVAALPDSATDTAVTAKIAKIATSITTATAAAFSIHNNEDDVHWNMPPLDPRTLGNAAATGEDDQHVDHCGLQVFDLLSSDSESEDEFDASELDNCDGF
jgi:hypothetical protein